MNMIANLNSIGNLVFSHTRVSISPSRSGKRVLTFERTREQCMGWGGCRSRNLDSDDPIFRFSDCSIFAESGSHIFSVTACCPHPPIVGIFGRTPIARA